MHPVMNQLLPPNKLGGALRKADGQSQDLLKQVYKHFAEKFRLTTAEQEAFNRLLQCAERHEEWDEALIRNNVFKAANLLGMKLPSSSF